MGVPGNGECPGRARYPGRGSASAGDSGRVPPLRPAAGRGLRHAGQSAPGPPRGAALKPGAEAGAARGMWVRAALVGVALCACARAWLGGAVCAREAAGAGGARYVAFLSAGAGTAPALVESVWAAPGRLRACWARRDPRLVRAFRAACARRPPAAPGAALRRVLAALWRRRAACAEPVPPRSRRRRRGWTLPGTLWCGAGDSAGNWSELGLFPGPDRCCREHDQCWAQITALQFNYGIRNYRLHTVSHCDCDARFRRCLLAINDTVSNIIGITFFNLLEVPCFVLEESEECVQWHWWGGCERYGVVPLARMVQQNQYHPSLAVEERGSPTAQLPGKGKNFSRTGRKRLRQKVRAKPGRHQARRRKIAQQLQDLGTPVSARDKAELTTRHLAEQWGLEPGPATALTVPKQDLVGAEQGAGISARPCYGSIGASPATAKCGATPVPAVKGHRQQGPGRGCRCSKHLRKCEHQIAPHEARYQLHNVNSRTLLHCNCTHRLTKCLRRERDCSDMDVAVLADHIAMDCFVLEMPAACSPGRGSQHRLQGRGSGCWCCRVAVMRTALLLQQLYHGDQGCACTCTAAQKDSKTLGPSACQLQGQASTLEDTGQGRHPL
ncbi:group 3 secretory phospholipase A2 [Hirundo rustica]|uniref:group 3 secretory phospholipase A2 n=1 Tax=Hirundo rustica TaxID=43150 RepID=UPI001A940321|nr:group 3 secretory phospholipase A2 [Hirundo rustica]